MRYVSPAELVGTPLEGVYPQGFCVVSRREVEPAPYVPPFRAIPGEPDDPFQVTAEEIRAAKREAAERKARGDDPFSIAWRNILNYGTAGCGFDIRQRIKEREVGAKCHE